MELRVNEAGAGGNTAGQVQDLFDYNLVGGHLLRECQPGEIKMSRRLTLIFDEVLLRLRWKSFCST